METLPKDSQIFVGDDAQRLIDEQHAENPNKISLPPMPTGILDWTEDEQKGLVYSGDMNDKVRRLQHKLSFIWQDWGIIRNNERLIKIINEESAKDTDEFFIKQSLVLWIDRIGKILGSTPIVEELVYKIPTSETTDSTKRGLSSEDYK